MANRSYHRVMAAFVEKPWAILPSKLAEISEILVLRVDGEQLSEDEIQKRISEASYAAKPKRKMQSGGVAVIPVYGVITPRADMFTEMSGGTSMQTFMNAINQAVNDPNVASILLDIDSPGGQVDLVPEAAATLRAARAKKPVVAVANTMAASAAYWLAAQASELVVTPSGEVGSVGVFAAHNDVSKAMEEQGVKTTLISAGKFKTELSPYAPLTDEARAGIQATIDEYYTMFAKDVALGRRVSSGAVRKGFGEGRMVTAENAVAGGMADKVGTFEQTLSRMLSQAGGGGSVTSHSDLGNQIAASSTTFLIPDQNTDFDVTSFNNGGTSGSNVNIEFTWPTEPLAIEAEPEADDIEAESDHLDEEPQRSLTELRQASREAATSGREQYLALIRRITR